MPKYILFLASVLLSKYLLLSGAEIFPGKKHPELNSQPDRWYDDADSFDMAAAMPALGDSASASGLFSFLNKRQFGDCPSGAPFECGGFTCCYNGFSTCCDTKCCSANSTCINSTCCPKNAKVCPNGKCTYADGECCVGGHTCGGTNESGFNSNDTCCGDHCCYFGDKCCGTTCCDEQEQCCGGVCCPMSAVCVANGTACERVRGGRTLEIYVGSTVTKTDQPRTSSASTTSAKGSLATTTESTANATPISGFVQLRAVPITILIPGMLLIVLTLI